MAFDKGLEERLQNYFYDRHDLTVKRMFGGLCFMLSGHMCCAIINEKLMARVGPDNYLECLSKPHVSEMDFTGQPMKGLVYIMPDGFEADEDLAYWLAMCAAFTNTLPPKLPKPKKTKKNQRKIKKSAK